MSRRVCVADESSCFDRDCPRHAGADEARATEPTTRQGTEVRCGCTADAELGADSVCPSCGHRDHGRSGCGADHD